MPPATAAKKQYNREYRLKHRDELNAKEKVRRLSDGYAQRKSEYDKTYHQAHRAERLMRYKARYAAKLEQERRASRKRYADNPEKARACARASRLKHLAKRLAYNRNYHRIHGKEIALKRKWQARLKSAKRRALKRAASVNLKGIKAFVDGVKAKSSALCYYCGAVIPTKGRSLHFDHIVPISKGGQHSVANLCVSCAPCNLSKHNKPLSEWLKTSLTQQLLPI